MSDPKIALLVRFKSPLSLEDVSEVINNRIDDFRALTGLKQKYYLLDTDSGEYAGLYLWDSPEALNEYRSSELRATIGKAYQTEGEPRVEVFQVINALRDTAF